MILVILFFVMIACSILLRIISYRGKKTDKFLDKKRLSIGALILGFIYATIIAYFVTDISIGFMYVFLTLILYYITMYFSHIQHINLLNSLILIVGIPLTSFLFVKAFEYILINFIYILLPVLIPWAILFGGLESELKLLKIISLATGIGIAIFIFFVPYNTINRNNKHVQEVVAEEYLINKLNIVPDHVHADRNLRGKATEVIAYSNDIKITMIYRNGRIESYKLIE